MAIQVSCSNPQCGQTLSAPDELAGKQVKCPKCGAVLQVPGKSDGASASARRLGNYTIVRKLGEGGMGAVYEAIQEGLNRRVALKVLPQRLMSDPVYLERFRREAQAAAALDHPNIVQVHEIGQDKGHFFFSMQFVDGESLREKLSREGKLHVSEALSITAKIAEALDYAWNHGKIIHRDIKPDNILLTKESHVKLADLGLAKSTEKVGTVTQTGAGIGTPYYMSPEQAENAKNVDCRADIYSLGATFFHLLTGKVPFDGDSAYEIIAKVLTKPLPPIRELNPEVPEAVARVVEKMLAKKPEDRYQTPSELLRDLEDVRNSGPAVRSPGYQQDKFGRNLAAPTTAGSSPPLESGTTSDAAAAFAPTQVLEPQPVSPRHRVPREKPKGKKALFAGIAVAATVLIAVGIVIATRPKPNGAASGSLAREKPRVELSGSPASPKPTTGPAVAAQSDDARLNGLLEYAQTFAKEHSNEYDELIAKFRQVENDAKGTKYALMAQDERRKVEKAREAAATQAWQQLQAKAEELVKADRFGDALNAVETFQDVSPALKAFIAEDGVTALRQSLEKRAQERIDALLGEVEDLAKAKKFEEACKLCEQAKAMGVASMDEALSAKLEEIQELEAEAKQRAQEEADRLHAQVSQKLQELVKNRKYDEAFEMCETAAGMAQFEAIKDRLLRDKSDIERTKAVYDAAIAALPGQAGKPLSVKGIRGTLKEVKGDKLVLTAGGAEFTKPLSDLSAKELADLADSVLKQKGGEGFLSLAVFWLFEGDQDQAKKALDQAKAAGLDISAYETRLVPVLVVSSTPSSAAVSLDPQPETRAHDADTRKLETPLRLEVSKNTTYRLEISKDGYEPVTREVKVGQGGEHRVEVALKKSTLPAGLRDIFEVATDPKDKYGNPIRSGIDKTTRLPLEIRHKETGMYFVFIPAGTFVMGSPETEKDRRDDENQHTVTLTRPRYLGKYEVTVGEFKKLVQETEYQTEAERGGGGVSLVWDGIQWGTKPDDNWKNPNFKQTDDHPLVLVSWNDAQEFLKWLNEAVRSAPLQGVTKEPAKAEHYKLALPTEAEWEFACRAGTTSRFFWGDDERSAGEYANVCDRTLKRDYPNWDESNFATEDNFIFTAPVGRFKANALGLYDMLGNVWEWCLDWDAEYPAGKVEDPTGPLQASHRVFRGSGWLVGPRCCRSAMRGGQDPPGYRDAELGLRLKVDLSEIVSGDAPSSKAASEKENAESRTSASIAKLNLILIPAGKFIYQEGQEIDLPAFYIGKYEVSNAEYAEFVEWVKKETEKGEKGDPHRFCYPGYLPDGKELSEEQLKSLEKMSPPKRAQTNQKFGLKGGEPGGKSHDNQKFGGDFEKPNHPVVGVDWYDAWAYCRWRGGRLPTEQEWEKAVSWDPKLNRKRGYPWGDEFVARWCNSGEGEDGFQHSCPVKEFPRGMSAYGCFNMAGNVGEWCDSWHASREFRFNRGGCWGFDAALCRTGVRDNRSPGNRYDTFGFRLAKSAP